jgi:precorrin-3B synthase
MTPAQYLPNPTPIPSLQGGGERALRRGVCPGLSVPMPTGDGLLVRLLPTGTIALAAFAALCSAARAHGNGVVEITARGSIQVRGLNADSAMQFAAAVARLDIAAADGIAVLASPLSGLDDTEVLNAGLLAADLRAALTQSSLATELAPKVSVVIDGGGTLTLDELDADVRLRAVPINGGAMLRVGVGGDGASAIELGLVTPARGPEAATRLLELIAQRGRAARARDILATEDVAVFRTAIAGLIPARRRESGLRGNEREKSDAIGRHRLRGGALACGIGLAFGHADASLLERLAAAAADAGATGVRAAPGRVLMTIGLTQQSAPCFVACAERLGFIVRADDPRRRVVACAGAPICPSAYIAARAMAPHIAAIAASHGDRTFTIHISGCAKGCAHQAAAALTVVGTPDGCALVSHGTSRDIPHAVVPASELSAAVARLAQPTKREDGHV